MVSGMEAVWEVWGLMEEEEGWKGRQEKIVEGRGKMRGDG